MAGWGETGFLRQFGVSTRNLGRNPVSGISGVGRNRVSAENVGVSTRNLGRNPVSGISGWGETGFMRQFGVSTRNLGRNPVSGISGVGRNRVSATIWCES